MEKICIKCIKYPNYLISEHKTVQKVKTVYLNLENTNEINDSFQFKKI